MFMGFKKFFGNYLAKLKVFLINKIYGKELVTSSFYDENGKLLVFQEIRNKNGKNVERF